MPKTIRAIPANPTQAAGKGGLRAVVFGAPTGNNLVGTTHKQLANLTFDSSGVLALDVDDVAALSAGNAVKIYAESASESFSALLDAVVESTAATLDPTAWVFTPAAAQNVALQVPGGSAAAGDRLIIVLGLLDSAGANRTATAPTAQGTWNTVIDDGFNGQFSRLYVYDRELTATLTTAQLNNLGANTYAITTSENQRVVAAVIKCRGSRTQPVAISPSAEFSSSPIAPSSSVSVADSTVLRVCLSKNFPRSADSPGTEIVESYGDNGTNGHGLIVSWSREAVQTALPAAPFTLRDPYAGGAITADAYTAATIVLDGTGGAAPAPAVTGAKFLFGAHQHGRPRTSGSFERYPGGSEFDYSVIRSHNAEWLQANGQHMGWWTGRSNNVNVYDWAVLDDWCAYHKARGRRMLWNCFGTPTFLARNATVDAYGIAGGSSYVSSTNRPAYRQFVADTVQRILATQGADFLVGVEVWNEPIGGEVSDNSQFLKANGYANDWSLSSIQQCIADIHQDVYLGVRSVSLIVPVIGFAHAWWTTTIDKVIAARCTDGSLIYQYCDAFSFHPYGFSDQWDASNANGRSLSALKTDILARLPASQRGKPLWATECALPELWSGAAASTVWWKGQYTASKAALAAIQYNWIQEFKAGGWAGVFVYTVDGGWANSSSAGVWAGGDASSGYNFLGLSDTAVAPARNAEISTAWSLANANLHSYGA